MIVHHNGCVDPAPELLGTADHIQYRAAFLWDERRLFPGKAPRDMTGPARDFVMGKMPPTTLALHAANVSGMMDSCVIIPAQAGSIQRETL